MKIGNKNVAEIQILDRDNDLIVSMVDENVIIEKDYPMRRKTPCFSYGDIRRIG